MDGFIPSSGPPIRFGADGQILGMQKGFPVFGPTSSFVGSSGIGNALAFSPASGTIDPTITGFVAGVGSAGTGRLKITLSADTSFEGLPAGADGQQLFLLIVAGAFTLTLLHLNGATAQAQIFASVDFSCTLNDCLQLFYDIGLSKWVLVP